MSTTPRTPARPWTRSASSLAVLALMTPCAWWANTAIAGTVDLANVPLSTAVSFSKPNIMFILDDSLSMGFDWMPDNLGQALTYPWVPINNYGYRSSQCNGVAYNPAVIYNPPLDANGVSYPNATYTAAWMDGFNTAGGTVNLSVDTWWNFATNYHYYYVYTGSQPAMSWSYSNTGAPINNTFNSECMSAPGAWPGNSVFTQKDANNLSAAEKTNFANWFSYYRTRQLTMRSSAGQAIAKLDANYRVGFTTINDSAVSGAGFLDVNDFNTSQRNAFFNLLYTSNLSNGGTPLRASLSKVGRYYAKRVSGQVYDPMANSSTDTTLNSCRRNYALLSTDGIWNGANGVQLDGATAIGDEDGAEASPMKDALSSSGSLADVAQYYYANDLRTDIPNGNMRVAVGSRDTATWQHMTTFTLGMGVKGVLNFDKNYLTQITGDYVDLKNGTLSWPNSVTGGDITHVDDLWHAAVNGRGQYFSAQNPLEVANGLSLAFNAITAENGTSTAAASSSLKPVSGGEDLVFVPRFSSAAWSGDLRAYHYTYDTTTKEITGVNTADGKELWSAKAKLDVQTTRKVYFNNAGTLTLLTYANLPTGTVKTSFDNRCTSVPTLTQCSSLTTGAAAQVTGTNIVDFITGSRALEMTAAAADNRAFRSRDSRLGDFVNASPVYVAGPPFRYADPGYASFAVTNANRTRVVYAAANDGMLHAFATGTTATQHTPDTTGGTELWAFTPTPVMGELWRLADTTYDNDHRFYVDATPVTADVRDSAGVWHTVIVGGLGKGGRGYYALDITDPVNPKVLWEIDNTTSGFANLGLSFGSPIITKLKDGTWSVIFSSGTNNVSPGDGKGHVFVVNAVTGAKLADISTNAGSTTTPSNLNQLNGWIDSDTDNTALRLYGGDMLGNLWRFDHDDSLAPTGSEAALIGTATSPAGAVQPITSQPALVELTINGTPTPIITFGTGRYLGTSDLTDNTVQSIYVVKDMLGAAVNTTTPLVGTFRDTAANMVKQTMNASHQMGTAVVVDWATRNGWYVDLDQSTRERINHDPIAISGSTVSYVSTVPDGSVCPVGGSSYVYDINLQAGTFTKTAAYTKMVVGISRFLSNANTSQNRKISTLTTLDDQTADVIKRDPTPPKISTTVKRSAWRELVD